MNVYMAAVPLFDADMAVQAYRLRDRSSATALGEANNYKRTDEAFFSPALNLLEQVSVEPFAGDKPLFVSMNYMQLLSGMTARLGIEPSKLVCVLPASLPPDAEVLERCASLQGEGYELALDSMPSDGLQNPLLEYAGTLILDHSNPHFSNWYAQAGASTRPLRLVLENVHERNTFDVMRKGPNTLFSGDFYSRPITEGKAEISPLKVNALQLLRQVNEDDFELEDIAAVIGRDPSLSISLLRFINSGAVGLSRRVDSIQTAVAILGQEEIRRWATVAISVSLAEDRPGEITRLSLVRAKFAENLAVTMGLYAHHSALFMAGLFSLLDTILEKPMEEAIREVAVNDNVRAALVDRAGPLYPALELVYAYERADWDKTSILVMRHQLDSGNVIAAFIEALVWYSQLLKSIDNMPES